MLSIKETILAYYTQILTRYGKERHTNVGFTNAQLVGILYTQDNAHKHEAMRCFAETLQKLGKQVLGLCYVAGPGQVPSSAFPTVTQDDVKFWGMISHPHAKYFVNTALDYLYHVDLVSNPVLDYLLAKSQAKCRVGHFDPARTPLFEIMVSFDRKGGSYQIDDLAAQMLHYTQLLKA